MTPDSTDISVTVPSNIPHNFNPNVNIYVSFSSQWSNSLPP